MTYITYTTYITYINHNLVTRRDPDILNKLGALCRPPWLADEENFRVQMVLKGQNNVRNYKFLANYFFQYFQIFKKEKTLMQQSMRIEKLRNIGVCFIASCFIIPFKMIINHFSPIGLFIHKIFFYFANPFAALLFIIRMAQEISKGEIGSGK